MIIRTTFSDNDYTHLLEKYWDRFLFDNCYSALEELGKKDDEESIRLWVTKHKRIEELIENTIYNEDKITDNDVKEFEDLIKESIIAYVDKVYIDNDVYSLSEYANIIEYLEKSISVRIKKQLKDTDENGEVVYYLLKAQKYITM